MANPLYDALFGGHAGSDAVFLRLPDGTAWSYHRFLGLASRFAHVLTQSGLQPGDRLAAQIPKCPQALALYAACVQAGIVFLPLNTAYTIDELTYFIGNSGAKMVVCDASRTSALSPIAQHNQAILHSLSQDGSGSLADQAADQSDVFATVDRALDDLAALLYTSGTTGRSKGAMITQRNLLSNAMALKDAWRFTADDRLLHALPIFHTHGLFVATNITLLAGGSMILLPKFEIDAIMAHLPDATTMMGVPTFYIRLLSDTGLHAADLAHMRLFISGSAPLLAETHAQFHNRFGHQILERYGMTETNMITSNPYNGDRRPGTVGFPLPGVEIRITDPKTGALCPDGDIGQIEVRGPNVFKGYWQMPDKTAEELRGDGFFITGDLGCVDSDGYLSIIGRNKDLIISGGYNIYPKEIEEVLDAVTGIVESAVIGVPHPDLGEAAIALIVTEPDQEPDRDLTEKTLAAKLARYKRPHRVIQINELPRNTMGKVQKAALRETHKDAFVSQ